MKALMKAAVRRAFRTFGLEINRARGQRMTQGAVLDHVLQLGFQPRTVIDIGVGNGTPWLYERFKESNLLLVEPLIEFKPTLDRIALEYGALYELAAAGAKSEERTINLRPDWLEASSNYNEPENLVRRTVPVVTLDELCTKTNLSGPYLIKADVEGAELEVLDGARRILAETELIFLEVSFFEFFAGAPQFYDVVQYMKDRGFVVYDIVSGFQRPLDGALAQTDVAFVKENGMFRKSHAYEVRGASRGEG